MSEFKFELDQQLLHTHHRFQKQLCDVRVRDAILFVLITQLMVENL